MAFLYEFSRGVGQKRQSAANVATHVEKPRCPAARLWVGSLRKRFAWSRLTTAFAGGRRLCRSAQPKLTDVRSGHNVSARSIVPARVAVTLPVPVPAASTTWYTLPMLVTAS